MTTAKNAARPAAKHDDVKRSTRPAAARKKIARTQEERNALARESMCKAALELFAIQGYHDTTLSDIGLRAGYSRGLAHHYFGTKDALAELLLEELGQRDTQSHILLMSEATTGVEAWHKLELHMENAWRNFCDLHFENHEDIAERGALVLRATAAFSAEPQLKLKSAEIAARLIGHVERALRLCARDGIIRGDLDLRNTAMIYISAIAGMSQLLHLELIDKKSARASIEPLKGYMDSLKKK